MVKLLGKGNFGSTSLYRKEGNLVVIKEIVQNDDPEQWNLFCQDLTILQMANHKNIVKFISVVPDDSMRSMSLLLEYVVFDFKALGKEYAVSSLGHL